MWCTKERCSGLTMQQGTASALLLVYGLAAMTTSPLVLSAVGFVCLATWFASRQRGPDPSESVINGSVLRESVMMGTLLLALLILLDARGVLPFQ